MCLCSGISEVTTMYKFYFGLECSPVIVVLYYPLGQYGVVEAALYRPSPGNAPVKVAIKKTKVCLFMCAHACVCVSVYVSLCQHTCAGMEGFFEKQIRQRQIIKVFKTIEGQDFN